LQRPRGQYLSMRNLKRLSEANASHSMGRLGDSDHYTVA
jgi:hypothetical protein